jgi:proline iminopeptidase
MSGGGLRVKVDGGHLIGTVTGTGPPLIVLHGGPGLSDYTELLRAELGGWTVVRYTQRGCPPATAGPPYTVASNVADVLAVLDALELESAVLVGHSWGAFLGCAVAASAGLRVRGMVLIDGLGVVGDGGLSEFEAQMRGRLAESLRARFDELEALIEQGNASDADALESFRLYWPSYFADPVRAPAPPPDLLLSVECSTRTFESLSHELETGSLAGGLRRYDGAVEILYGTSSPMPARASTDTAALLTNAAVHPVAEAGHFPWIEAPGCVAAALSRLAARLS